MNPSNEKLQAVLDACHDGAVRQFEAWVAQGRAGDLGAFERALEPLFAAQGAVLVQMSPRPFGPVFELQGALFQLKVTARQVVIHDLVPR